MRTRLLEATVDCLSRRGYGGTTAEEIARAAGVTRGAQLHHFGTKAELVTAAVEHHFDKRRSEFLDAFDALPEGVDRTGAAIDLLWSMVRDPAHYASLELIVAARTDAALRERVREVHHRFIAHVHETFRQLFPSAADRAAIGEAMPALVLAVSDGLVLSLALDADDPWAPRVIELLKDLVHRVAPPRSGTA